MWLCLAIWLYEVQCMFRIVRQYSKDLSVEEFLCRAPLDEILRVRGHSVMSSCMLCMASIFSVMRI